MMPTTIREIAKLADVSSGTVSRVLNNDPTLSVTEKTRARVKKIANDLAYHHSASSQKKNTLVTVAIVTSMSEQREIDDPYWRNIHQGIKNAAQKQDIKIGPIIRLTDGLGKVNLSHFSAVIVTGDTSADAIKKIKKMNQNLVLVDARSRFSDIDIVQPDLSNMTERILNELHQAGRQNIAFIGGNNEQINLDGKIESVLTDSRTDVYEKWVQRHKQAKKMLVGNWTAQAGTIAAKQLLAQAQPFDALLVASDTIAVGAIKVLQEAGFVIGRDISIVSFDDLALVAYLNPSLTTVNLPQHALGSAALQQAKELADRDRTWTKWTTIPSKLIYRDSFQK
ncbi:MAG: LacI family DNA-binding transcriptional regulator [Oenococcus sicerae]